MGNVLSVTSPKDWHGIAQEGAVPPLDPGKWNDDAPDLHLMVIDRQDRLRARCSLWWRNAPAHGSRRLGAIGHYAACDDASAAALLQDASLRLAACKCDYAVGPLDGSTWRSYRFVTDPGNSPPFFLEPTNPPEYPLQFVAAGFGPFAEYVSALRPGPMAAYPQADEAERRLEKSGVIIRPLDPTRLEDELQAIHQASLVIFRQNILFSPISEAEFRALYAPVLSMLQPDTFLLAEREGQLVGFVLGIPNYLQAQRGKQVDTLIIKTLVRRPEPVYAGLGAVLLRRCETIGAQHLGYHRSIHALMHVDNASLTLSKRTARPIRRYTLFGKELPS
ncbi:MAG: GNAT family N-acetyltransferase [Candidatus Hydrogenedentes bacterium]|nr:GNAT family N-acetyltransferase [Candidatus Hydrogenedentota bacterium]